MPLAWMLRWRCVEVFASWWTAWRLSVVALLQLTCTGLRQPRWRVLGLGRLAGAVISPAVGPRRLSWPVAALKPSTAAGF